jgi:DNA replication protein DnaC
MNRLPFEHLKDSMQFQQLCAELLQAEGCKNVRGLGTGADQGNDFMFDLPVESPLGTELKPYIAQCKWYNFKNSIGEGEVSSAISYIDTHSAAGILILTSSQLSGTAVTKTEAINRSPRNSYQIVYWNGTDLTRRLSKHPKIINKFFYTTEDGEKGSEIFPEYDEEKFLKEFSLYTFEQRYSIDTFPEVASNEIYVSKLKKFAKTYLNTPPKVVLLSGVVGSGKTGYGCSLLNLKVNQGLKVAVLQFNDYQARYFQYHFNESGVFLPFYKFCQDVDVLFFDDFGMFLSDKSEPLVEAAKSCVKLIQERSKKGKLTIVSIADDMKHGKTIANYVEHLKVEGFHVRVGDQSLRLLAFPVVEEDAGISMERENSGYFLGKNWLMEKYELVESHINQAVKALLRPEEQDYALRKRLIDEYGDNESREDEILGELNIAKKRLREYREYISAMNFKAVYIYEDGRIDVVK